MLLMEIERKESKTLHSFQKLLQQINQSLEYNQSRQGQSSRENVFQETTKNYLASQLARHIWKYWYHAQIILLKKLYLEVMKLRSQCISEKLLRKKLFVLQHTNNDKVKVFCVLHNKVALLTRTCSEWGTKNRHQRIFRKFLTIKKTLIKR